MSARMEQVSATSPRRRNPSTVFAVAHRPRRRRRHVLRRRRSSSTGEEEAWQAVAPPPLKQLMKYAVPALLALLVLRYQYKPDALFRENWVSLWSFTAATAVYWLVAEAMTRCRRRYGRMLSRVALAVGVQSALSLLSMFLPHPFSLLPLLVPLLTFSLFFACTQVPALLIRVTNKIRAMAVRTRVGEVPSQPHSLPV